MDLLGILHAFYTKTDMFYKLLLVLRSPSSQLCSFMVLLVFLYVSINQYYYEEIQNFEKLHNEANFVIKLLISIRNFKNLQRSVLLKIKILKNSRNRKLTS